MPTKYSEEFKRDAVALVESGLMDRTHDTAEILRLLCGAHAARVGASLNNDGGTRECCLKTRLVDETLSSWCKPGRHLRYDKPALGDPFEELIVSCRVRAVDTRRHHCDRAAAPGKCGALSGTFDAVGGTSYDRSAFLGETACDFFGDESAVAGSCACSRNRDAVSSISTEQIGVAVNPEPVRGADRSSRTRSERVGISWLLRCQCSLLRCQSSPHRCVPSATTQLLEDMFDRMLDDARSRTPAAHARRFIASRP